MKKLALILVFTALILATIFSWLPSLACVNENGNPIDCGGSNPPPEPPVEPELPPIVVQQGAEVDIEKALDKLPIVGNYKGGLIELPPGQYDIEDVISIHGRYQGITFQGSSPYATIFMLRADTDMFIFENISGVTFRDVGFMNPMSNYPERADRTGSALTFRGGGTPFIDHCYFWGFVGAAVKFEGAVVAPRITNSYIAYCGDPDKQLASIHYDAGSDRINDILTITNTEIGAPYWRSIYADERVNHLTVNGCYIEVGSRILPETEYCIETYCPTLVISNTFVLVGDTVILDGAEVDVTDLEGNFVWD